MASITSIAPIGRVTYEEVVEDRDALAQRCAALRVEHGLHPAHVLFIQHRPVARVVEISLVERI